MMQKVFNSIKINSIAACVPSTAISVDAFVEQFGEQEIEKIKKLTGIERIRIASEGICASDLCERAARELINHGFLDVKRVDGIIFISQTPDYILPTTSLVLQSKLGISTSTVAFDISYGCSAYIYGLFQASLLIDSGFCEYVLLFCGDKITPFINNRDRSIKLLFGDGGSATVIEKGNDEIAFDFYSDGSGGNKLIIPAGGCRLPRNSETNVISERENGNWRSDENLFMDGGEIMNFALNVVPKSVKQVAKNINWEISDVDIFGFHQANAFMLKYIAKIMKVPLDKVPISMRDFGNTGPASIPLMLTEEFEKLRDFNQLNKVILSGFGVGLSCASSALTLQNTNFIKTVEY